MTASTSSGGGSRPIDDARQSVTDALELHEISKRFATVLACDRASLAVACGEVHGLLGENGAGKSTLMKVLAGVFPPDSGEIRIEGRAVSFEGPLDSQVSGISMASQHLSLVPRLRVWENVALAHRGRLSKPEILSQIDRVEERYGLNVDPEQRVEELSLAQRQRVELAKCLSVEPRILILDEPTAVLSRKESSELFEMLRRINEREKSSIILISHKIDELIETTDRISVMREGTVVETVLTKDTSARALVHQMIGREIHAYPQSATIGVTPRTRRSRSSVPRDDAPAVLRLIDVSVNRSDGRTLLDSISLEVRSGEILGVGSGDDGGQQAITDLLSGLVDSNCGEVYVVGSRVNPRPDELLSAGVSVIPEDRHASALMVDMEVGENLFASGLDEFRKGPFLDRRKMSARARQLMDEFGVMAPSPSVRVDTLSGGNQQRVVIARELAKRPSLLVACEPSRGLDVGGIELMYERLAQCAANGAGVLLLVSDPSELCAVADRIVVLFDGRVVGEFEDAGLADPDLIGALIGGHLDA